MIAHGWDHVVEVGRALREIHDEGLYLELDGGITFEQYVKSRWALPKRTAYRWMGTVEIQDAVCQIGTPITTEVVANELRPLLEKGGPELVAEAWSKIADRYQGQRPPTAREVNKALVEDGYRERVIGPSSGKVNISVRLGMFGDKLIDAEKRLRWFIDKELGGKPLVKRDRERAVGYAATLETMAATLRQLGSGEVPE